MTRLSTTSPTTLNSWRNGRSNFRGLEWATARSTQFLRGVSMATDARGKRILLLRISLAHRRRRLHRCGLGGSSRSIDTGGWGCQRHCTTEWTPIGDLTTVVTNTSVCTLKREGIGDLWSIFAPAARPAGHSTLKHRFDTIHILTQNIQQGEDFDIRHVPYLPRIWRVLDIQHLL